MWKIQKETNLLTRLIVILVFVAQISDMALALSDKRLCADENCREIISLGTGKINYRAGEEGMLSFKINAPIRIKSKSAGKDLSLWGIEVGGREGYAPKEYIRETKIKIGEKLLKYEVDVVKPESAIPVLNTSEKNVGQANEAVDVTTTTKPLDMIPVESKEEPIARNPVENASAEKPTDATPVLMEMVDGTQIPLLDDNVDGDHRDDGNKDNTESKSDEQEIDDEIGDYDEDDEDVDLDNDLEDEDKTKLEPRILSQMENPNIKSSDIEQPHGYNEKDVQSGETTLSDKLNYLPLVKSIKTNKFDSNPDYTEEKASGILIASEFFDISPNGDKILPSAEVLTDASQPFEVINNVSDRGEKTSENVYLQEGPIDDKQVIEKEKNLDEKLPLQHQKQSFVDPPLVELPTNKNKENIPAEKTENLAENIEKYNTKDTLDTGNMSHIESLPESEASVETKSENRPTSDNKEEELVSDSSQEQHLNIEVQIGNEKYEENITTENLQTKPESTFSTAQTESSISEQQLATDSATVKHNSVENQQQDILESSLNKPNPTQTEIPPSNAETATESPSISVPSQTYNDHHLQTTTESSVSSPYPIVDNEATVTHNSVENQQQDILESSLNKPNPTQTEIPPSNAETATESPSISAPSQTYNDHHLQTTTEPSASSPYPIVDNEAYQQQTDFVSPTPYNPYDGTPSNTPLPPKYDYINKDSSSSSPSSYSQHTTEIPQYGYYDQQPIASDPPDYLKNEVGIENLNEQTSNGYDSVEPLQPMATPDPSKDVENDAPKALPSSTPPTNEDVEMKENRGLFATIMGTVNNMLSSNKKGKYDEKDELHRILFPDRDDTHKMENKNEGDNIQYCEKLGPNGDCPHLENKEKQPTTADNCECNDVTKTIFTADLTIETFLHALAAKILEISELLAFLAIVAAASLFFIFGYYCFCNSSREGALLSKLNQLESSLLATHKENAILKHNLMSTRQKLASIEDNSFGSNDMVVSLKRDLEEELLEKAKLQEQITNLQKELENAADAGIELNKIVSELLSNQTGDESIISSVEELQKQLNEQQNTILEINASLAEKSRENSELQLLIAEQNARYESEIDNLQRDNDELEQEKGNLQTRLEEIRSDFDKDITGALEGKNFEIKRLQNEIVELTNKIENEHTKWQTSMAKVEALEECLKNVKRDPNVNITQVIDVANVRAELLDSKQKYTTLKERLEAELDSRKLAESQLQIVSAEVEKLKQDFNQTEKDKLEAQTRLEVLSNYFKEKENQLQKELSLKEAMWLKQQGETTTTVDRLTSMQEEIQSLKSQNDSLRAEIEAQIAAHKAQTGTLENRAHETWLAARQSDRRYEEARAEATALRRKLTAFAGVGNLNEINKPPAGSAGLGDELTNAPSPIHMESPGSPMLGRMPPPPFLPPPFMGPPPPFLGMPPPPQFVPPGEMRPAPLGRIMSPPPQRSGRFSPQQVDYEDYLDYEGGNNTWHRHTYSPPPRTYRSLSPTDSRYNYGTDRELISTYDTETDFSPPPSPRESRRRGGGGGNGSERSSNNTRSPYKNSKKSNSGNKGHLSSGSDKSYNSSPHHGSKTKGGNTGGGKSLV